MICRKGISSKKWLVLHLIIVLIIISLFSIEPALSKNHAKFDVQWSPDTPGKSYNVNIMYIPDPEKVGRSTDSEIDILSDILGDNDVNVMVRPISNDEFDAVSPTGIITLGPKFRPESDWWIELKDNAENPKLCLYWEIICKDMSGKASKPSGMIPLDLPKESGY